MAQATIQIQGDANPFLRSLRQVERGLRRVERNSARSNKALASMSNTASKLNVALTAAGVALAGFAIRNVVTGVIDATTNFERFRAQLTTFLGDARFANAELARLEDLAMGLPQHLNDLTEGFIVLSRNGMDTSNESMKAFANIASATGKTVQQAAQAFEDAMRGEFERMKEFGVKISKEGDKFIARFGDQIIAVGNTATELTQDLVGLGKEGGRYFGAAERQANDLSTALSNLDASVEKAQRAIGEAGLAAALQATANQISDLLKDNPKLIQDIGVGFTKAFLYAKEAAIILAKNLDIVGYTLAAVFGASILKGIIGFAGAIAGPLVGAFVLLGKAAHRSAMFLLRHPIIAAVAAIVGGIEYLTGAVSGLAEKMGLLGDEGLLNELADDALNAGKAITDYVGGGVEYVSDLQERVNQQAEEYRLAMEKVNDTMSDTEAALERQRQAEEKKKQLAEAQAKLFDGILADKQEELRITSLSADEQEKIRLIKEAEKRLNRELNETEKARIADLVRQTQEIQKQNELREKIVEIQDEIFEISGLGFAKELNAINEATKNFRKGIEERHGALQDFYSVHIDGFEATLSVEEMLQTESYRRQQAAAKKLQDYIFGIHEERLRRSTRLELQYSQYMKQFMDGNVHQQQRGSEEMERIVQERVEFEKKSELEKTQWAIGQMGDAFEALGRYNKQAFEASKALRIAEAIMATYQAATLALATYPPPFGFIGAAVAVAAGLANVAAIRSQTYSGRRFGGSVMEGESYLVGEAGPEIFTPASSGTVTKNSDIGSDKVVNVNFTINAMDTTSFDEMLLNRRGVIQQVIRDAVLETGQRSRF